MNIVQVAAQVTTAIALIAFISALLFLAYRARLKNELEVVKSADSVDKIRALRSVRGLLFDIDESKLSSAETLELAKQQISESSRRATRFLIASIILAIILLVAAILLDQRAPAQAQPTQISLRNYLETATPEGNLERLLASWGEPTELLYGSDIFEENFDGSGEEEPAKILTGDDYFVQVYNVENAVDVYVVRVKGVISGVGLGLRDSKLFRIPMLKVLLLGGPGEEDKEIKNFVDANMSNFLYSDHCFAPKVTHVRSYYGPIECVFGRCCGGYGAEHHMVYKTDELCQENTRTNYDEQVIDKLCGVGKGDIQRRTPFLAIAYIGKLHPDMGVHFSLRRAISTLIADYAVDKSIEVDA